VIVAVVVVSAGQLGPQLIMRFDRKLSLSVESWWIALLPPAWFAGLDDALAGGGGESSWALGGVGLIATALVVWLAFGKLAGAYQTGLQALSETVSAPRRLRAGRRWVNVLVKAPPLRWWLRDSVSRASFLLTTAYLLRDRDVKLRVYPGLAPMLAMPVIILCGGFSRDTGGIGSAFGIAFAAAYLGLIPLLALNMLRYSQQWQAADLFRVAPMQGPTLLCHGARRAVLCFLALPAMALFTLMVWLARHESSQLLLLLPGLIAVPVYAMIPCLGGKAVPLSLPTEDAESAHRGLVMFLVMAISLALSGLAAWGWTGGWFWWLVLVETVVAGSVYATMRASLATVGWAPLD